MPKPETFGGRLAQARREKAARERRDILQKDVAAAIKTTPTTVSRWEAGVNVPDDEMVRRLAKYFGVTPGWLRYGEGVDEPASSPEIFYPTDAQQEAAGRTHAKKGTKRNA